jgi:hypothetical protein
MTASSITSTLRRREREREREEFIAGARMRAAVIIS